MDTKQLSNKVADYIEANPERYEFHAIYIPDLDREHTCGCVIGLAAALEGYIEDPKRHIHRYWARLLFGVDGLDFYQELDRYEGPGDSWRVSAADAVKVLRRFAEEAS